MSYSLSSPRIMWLGIFIAVLLVFVTRLIGTPLHFFLLPFIFWIIYNEKCDFFPGLSLLLITESFVLFLILSCVFITVIIKWRRFYFSEARLIFILTLSLLPLFIWLFFQYQGQGIIVPFKSLQYYFAFFPFFYGMLISREFEDYHVLGIIFILALALIFQITDFFGGTVRLIVFAIPFFISVFFVTIFKTDQSFNKPVVGLFSSLVIILYIANLNSTVFNVLLVVILSSIIAILRMRSLSTIKYRFLTSKWMFIISLGFIILTIKATAIDRSNLTLSEVNYETKFSSIASVRNFAYFKILGDRGPIWRSIWLSAIDEINILPVIKSEDLYIENTLTGQDYYQAMDSHNIYLELIRRFGVLAGPVLGFIYILMILKSVKLLSVPDIDPYLISLGATVFSVGLIGGLFGQFVLMPGFSFFLIGLAGILYGLYLQYI
jgi:hypothetical protein